jgi:hypothetical protein
MSFSMRIVGLVAACVAGCVPDVGEQKLHGTAVLIEQPVAGAADGAPVQFDNSVIVVCGFCIGDAPCDCTGTNSPPVAADGSYMLDREGQGLIDYSASAPSTLEGSVEFSVDGDGDLDAPSVALTPLGEVTGTVTGLPVLAGVVVTVDGSSVTATTDALGAFTLAGILSGSQTLTAFQPGSTAVAVHANAEVPYASAATVALDFSADP